MCKNHEGGQHHTFLWGLVAGAVLGVILAPESGEKTRKKLKVVGEEYKEKGMEAYSIASGKFEEVKGIAVPLAKQVESTLGPLLAAALESGEPIKDDVVSTIADLMDKYGKKETLMDKLKKKL